MRISKISLLIATLSALNTSQAATFTWAGATGTQGTLWDRKQNWAGNPANPPTSADNVVFATSTFTALTSNGADSALDITFNSGASTYTLGLSGQTLTIGNGTTGGIVNNSTAVQTFSSPIAVSGNQTWDAASGNLSFSGAISGSSALTLSGANTINMSGVQSGTGSLIQSGAGTLNITAANTYSGGATINAGTVNITSAGVLSGGATTINGGTVNVSTVGGLGSGAITLAGGTLSVAANLSAAGTFGLNGGTLSVDDTSAARTISFGALTLNGASTVNLTDNANFSSITFSSADRTSGSLAVNSWVNNASRDKIFVSGAATQTFLDNVAFTGFSSGGQIVSGELVPAGVTPVPEPHEYAIVFGLGLLGFAAYRRRTLAQA